MLLFGGEIFIHFDPVSLILLNLQTVKNPVRASLVIIITAYIT